MILDVPIQHRRACIVWATQMRTAVKGRAIEDATRKTVPTEALVRCTAVGVEYLGSPSRHGALLSPCFGHLSTIVLKSLEVLVITIRQGESYSDIHSNSCPLLPDGA